ncbi:MAG: PIG-L deacetylase family protein [Candidatus Methylomirabilales bacterium]
MQILVISIHPDDETLGCGGTLLKHRAADDCLYWLIITQTYKSQWSAEMIERKAAEVEQAAQAYEMEQYFKLGFPTVLLDTIPQADLIGRIRDVISEVKPELIYLVHYGDVHTDHHAVFTAIMSVLKPSYMTHLGVRRVLCYEILSSTEAAPPQLGRAFMPNVFSDITPYIERKIEIMDLYQTERQPDPLPRGPSAIRALARYRGATVGVDYAEAFMLVREIW